MKREKSKDELKHYCNSIFKELWAWKRNPEIAVTYFMKSQPWHSCIAKEAPLNGTLTGTLEEKEKPTHLVQNQRVPCLSLVALTEEGTSTGGQLTWPRGLE